mgnify:CR=1 FL=1
MKGMFTPGNGPVQISAEAIKKRVEELEDRLKAIYDAWNYEGDGPDPMYGVMNVTERKFWGGGENG